MRIGILTGGGDCPGLNAVIRAVVVGGSVTYDDEAVGFLDGWRGVVEGAAVPLLADECRGILTRGGTIIGSSRTNPFATDAGPDRVLATVQQLGIDALVAVGGNDTLGAADRLASLGLPVVGVPKTIDNDLPGTEVTFGFDTAVQVATEAIDRLQTTAESHHRVMVCEVMGRYVGHIAVHAGIAGGAAEILIPEVPFSIEAVCERLRLRHSGGRFSPPWWWPRAHSPVTRARRGARAPGCWPAGPTSSGTAGSGGSAGGWPRRSRATPATRRGPPYWAISNGEGRRPPSIECWPPGSVPPRWRRSTMASSGPWWPSRRGTSCVFRCRKRAARRRSVDPHLYESVAGPYLG